jgi:hypothetical protein
MMPMLSVQMTIPLLVVVVMTLSVQALEMTPSMEERITTLFGEKMATIPSMVELVMTK